MASVEYVTGNEYIYITGKGDQRRVKLNAVVNGTEGTIQFVPSKRVLTVPLDPRKLIAIPADSTDKTKNTNGATTPESETTMSAKATTTPTTTRKATGKAPVKRAAKATPKADAPATLPPITPTPATVGDGAKVKIPGLDISVPAAPASVPMPTASPESVATLPTPINAKNNTRKEMNLSQLFRPAIEVYCDIHKAEGDHETLSESEAFEIPATPIPNGPVITTCAGTVWHAVDDVIDFWAKCRTSSAFLDEWIQEMGDKLPPRPDNAADDFEEYEDGEGQEGNESHGEPPAPATLPPNPGTIPPVISDALAAAHADLGKSATVRTAPPKAKAKASGGGGGGQKGIPTPGPSRIPRTLNPKATPFAKQFAIANGMRTNKGELITMDTRGKLPAEVLKAWLDSDPNHEGYVTSWEDR
jgi:hypothetical protein